MGEHGDSGRYLAKSSRPNRRSQRFWRLPAPVPGRRRGRSHRGRQAPTTRSAMSSYCQSVCLPDTPHLWSVVGSTAFGQFYGQLQCGHVYSGDLLPRSRTYRRRTQKAMWQRRARSVAKQRVKYLASLMLMTDANSIESVIKKTINTIGKLTEQHELHATEN